jgi:hypothetical protein
MIIKQMVNGRAVSARRALAHDEHSTRCGRSHLREQSEGGASTRGGAICSLIMMRWSTRWARELCDCPKRVME